MPNAPLPSTVSMLLFSNFLPIRETASTTTVNNLLAANGKLHLVTYNGKNLNVCSLVFSRDSDILMPGLASPQVKQIPHYFAGTPSLHPGFSTAQDNCDLEKYKKPRMFIIPIPE